jgi:hypothetical protein
VAAQSIADCVRVVRLKLEIGRRAEPGSLTGSFGKVSPGQCHSQGSPVNRRVSRPGVATWRRDLFALARPVKLHRDHRIAAQNFRSKCRSNFLEVRLTGRSTEWMWAITRGEHTLPVERGARPR